jgi:UDP-N-acetylmuramoyl-tripeptide--D-alanyl-D-alanine ligase
VSGGHASLPGVTASGETDPSSIAFDGDDLARVTGGRLLARSDRRIRGAAVDSRLVEPGQCFVALPGERTDGHDHIAESVERGAAAVLVTRPPNDPARLGDVTVVRVADGVVALAALASDWRARFQPIVVGVTGSIAKTSTKEAIAGVLASSYTTLKSDGNQNNEIGLPLTVLRLRPEHQAAVLEMGMYVGGEIADLAAIGRPSIGVITAVQPVHLARIGSVEAVEQAKGELLEALPRSGTAILNADDPIVTRMDQRTVAPALRYGFDIGADVRAADVSSAGFGGMRFRLQTPMGERAVAIPALGRLSVHNALAGAAVGIVAGVGLDAIEAGLRAGWRAPHRAEIVALRGVTIVDDSYNASPGSMLAALDLLAGLPGRHVAVLGEMLELGDTHQAGHVAVGEAAGQVADLLVVVGYDARGIVEGAVDAGLDPAQVHHVADDEDALEVLRPRLRDGDTLLVKASRGMALDRLVAALRRELGTATG